MRAANANSRPSAIGQMPKKMVSQVMVIESKE